MTAPNVELTVNHDFKITNAVLDNAGKYHCYVRNSVAYRKRTINLIFIGEIAEIID